MPDVYLTIGETGPAVVEPLIQILELRAADPAQRAMREAYFTDIAFPPGGRVVEVGCGPGPVARALAARPGVGEVIGVDPSPIFIAKTRELASSSSSTRSGPDSNESGSLPTPPGRWQCGRRPKGRRSGISRTA